jgi:hypothetical protein
MITFEKFCPPSLANNNQIDYVLGENVILLQVKDGTARILDFDGEYHVISDTAALIISETLKFGSEKVVDKLAQKYSIELSQAEEDVKFFLKELTDKKIIYHLEKSQNEHINGKTNLSVVLEKLLKSIGHSSIPLEIKALAILNLAYFSVRFFGWIKTVNIWQNSLSSKITISDEEKDKFIDAVDQAICNVTTYHLLNIECKERALCGWWLLCFAGIPAKLTVGIDLFPLASHCWCEVGKNVVGDDQERSEWFTPVFSWE